MVLLRIEAFFEAFPRPALVALAGVGVIGVGAADYFSQHAYSYYVLYAAPIAFSVWFCSRNIGLGVAIAAAFIWSLVDLGIGREEAELIPAIWNGVVRLGFFTAIAHALHVLREMERREREQAVTDPLTGLPNQRGLLLAATTEFNRAQRANQPVSIAYLDLDNFKEINDRWGHPAGDKALKLAAQAMRARLRAADIVARVGGDEFVALLPDTNLANATRAMNDLRREIRDLMRRYDWPVTVSIGLQCWESAPPSVEEAIARSDALMYQSKAEGKDRVSSSSLAAVSID